MDASETELRDRLKRHAAQIQGQHKRLEPLFAQLRDALASGSSRDAQTAAFRLDGAVRAHFQLEENVVFPAVRGLVAQNEIELDALLDDHRGLGTALQCVIDLILEARLDLAAQSLEKYWLAVEDHEAREEAFLSALDEAPLDRNL